jgi:putative addiction module killer protein
MIVVQQTLRFRQWLLGLREMKAIKRINQRLLRLPGGNFGDVKYFDGIGELRIDHGPGYRVYFLRRGDVIGHPFMRR